MQTQIDAIQKLLDANDRLPKNEQISAEKRAQIENDLAKYKLQLSEIELSDYISKSEKRVELEDDAKEKIELQVNQSVYKVNEAGKKLTASSRNKEKAEENLRHATIGFEEGVIPALNLMEAQTAWVEAQSDLIDAQIEVKLTDVYLSKALGRLSSTTNNK